MNQHQYPSACNPIHSVVATMLLVALIALLVTPGSAQPIKKGGERWQQQQAIADEIIADIHEYLDKHKRKVLAQRDDQWDRDFTSAKAYRESIAPNLKRFRHLIGLKDERLASIAMRHFGPATAPSPVAETDRYTVRYVQWEAIDGIQGEGLLLTPKDTIKARLVALPDAGQTPEQIAGLTDDGSTQSEFARRLAASGAQVIVPVLINRQSTFSGKDKVVPRWAWKGRPWEMMQTTMPHREWVFRQAYPLGRHIIGYEVQKVRAAIDWFEQQPSEAGQAPIGVAGYGEGGLLALYTAAVDPRVDATLVSGYFGPREDMATDPIYRSIWGFLTEFGGAEVASMVAPRPLVIEYSDVPSLDDAASGGLGGDLETPAFKQVQSEVERLRGFFPGEGSVQPKVKLIHDKGDTLSPGSDAALHAFLEGVGVNGPIETGDAPEDRRKQLDLQARQARQIHEIEQHIASLMRVADQARYRFFANPTDTPTPEQWDQSMAKYREIFRDDYIGKLPPAVDDPNARLQKVRDFDDWTLHQVRLDVYPEVFAFGMLGLPKDIKPGEKRPVVVLQHGIGGLPLTPIAVDSYNEVMIDLTKRGFITFAPHNPYRGWVRQAQPLKLSRFSILVRQHQQIVKWLQSREHVADDRIGFYGKSWGGDAALHIPPLVKGYALSICSAMFNDWPRKLISTDYRPSYLYTNQFGVWAFDIGGKFGHYEMAAMIAPRPFMVEEGYGDPVAPEAWAGGEFAKVYRLYDLLGIKDRTALGFFDGGHEIGKGATYRFLHEHLDWPKPEVQ